MGTGTQDAVTVEPRIAVVGIGGAGCNVVNDIYWADGSMDVIAVNTDKDSLKRTNADGKVYLCKDVTKGEGARGDTVLAERCAKAHIEEIRESLKGHDTVFIIAGMGGGTGTGVAPVVAAVAHSMNMMIFAIAIKPFSFETQRLKVAKDGISKISSMCPMTVVVENDRILVNVPPSATMNDAFRMVNESIVRFVAEKKQKLSEAMMFQISTIEMMITEHEHHSLSEYADITT